MIEIDIPSLKECLEKLVVQYELEKSLAEINQEDDKKYLLKQIDKKHLYHYQKELSILDANPENKRPVLISYLLLTLSLTSGSADLLELITSIQNSENEEIFETNVIKILIDFMWIRSKSRN